MAIKDSEFHNNPVQCWQTNGTIYGFGVGSSNVATHNTCISNGSLIIAGEVITDNLLNGVSNGYASDDVRFGAPYYAKGVITIED